LKRCRQHDGLLDVPHHLGLIDAILATG